jgi:hypothetical protein
MKKFALAALALGLLSSPATASWQLLPGRPFDGKSQQLQRAMLVSRHI